MYTYIYIYIYIYIYELVVNVLSSGVRWATRWRPGPLAGFVRQAFLVLSLVSFRKEELLLDIWVTCAFVLNELMMMMMIYIYIYIYIYIAPYCSFREQCLDILMCILDHFELMCVKVASMNCNITRCLWVQPECRRVCL